jgi:hypothetical protein
LSESFQKYGGGDQGTGACDEGATVNPHALVLRWK